LKSITKKLGLCVAALAFASVVLGGASSASASTGNSIPAGGWASTNTVPDYILANDGANVSYTPGTDHFTETWNPRFGAEWQDSYLVDGYSHGANSTSQAGSYGKYVYKMPLLVSSAVEMTGSMTYNVSSDFSGRAGWDVWLSPAGSENEDTTAASLEANPKTVEILLQPGSVSFESNPGYDRLFYGVGSLAEVNISEYVDKALAYLGLSPSDYYWAAVDGGAEMTAGSFTMDSYSLLVTNVAPDGTKTVDWGNTPVPRTGAATVAVKAKSKPKAKSKAVPVATVSTPVTLPVTTTSASGSGTSYTLYAIVGGIIVLLGASGAMLYLRRRTRN